MKKIILLLSIILLVSCSSENKLIKEINSLQTEIINKDEKIKDLSKKIELQNRIEKVKSDTLKRQIASLKLENTELKNSLNQETTEIKEEKFLDVAFYSQFPLDIATWIKYDEPYQNFCEEASILNAYYFLVWKNQSIEEYKNDLMKLKELEELLFESWYKHTNQEENLELLISFQWENQEILWEIIKNPSIEDIKNNISKWNVVIVPVYWKGLTNTLFLWWWPIYHNLVIKGYTKDVFITNEVWVSKWDWFKYKIDELMENIYDYDENLYPNNFTKWERNILILSKK